MRLKILISSAGRRGALVECFRDSATRLGVSLHISAADARPKLSAACELADDAVAVRRCDDPHFVPELIDYARANGIQLVVPTIDTELRVLSEQQERFAEIGIGVVISAPDVVRIAGDKMRTADVLRSGGVSTPQSRAASDYLKNPDELAWPVILKPRGGSSSVGLVRPRDRAEAMAAISAAPDLLVQELWQGREYTVNMYFDRTGALRCAVPHWRIETRGGEVSKGRTEDIQVLRDAAKKIAACLPGARGPLCFQAIVKDDGNYAVFEINARFGGGYPLAHRAGATFTQWLLEETLGLPCSASDNWRPGLTMLRYDDAVFIES